MYKLHREERFFQMMKLILAVCVYGVIALSWALLVFVIVDAIRCFRRVKREMAAHKARQEKLPNRVADCFHDDEFLKRLINAKPEAPEDLYK